MIAIVKEEDKEEGINEGIDIEKTKATKNGIKAGLWNDIIKIMTGMSDEQINKLRKQID